MALLVNWWNKTYIHMLCFTTYTNRYMSKTVCTFDMRDFGNCALVNGPACFSKNFISTLISPVYKNEENMLDE